MRRFAQENLGKALDLLIERLTFERAGVEFYDQIIRVMRGSHDPSVMAILDRMIDFRGQKKEHEEWLEEQIRVLGGDIHAESDLSRLVTRESEGIRQIVEGDYGVPHLFHALLQAELSDNAGWQLLLDLADRANDVPAREEFRKRLHEEEEHLLLVRRAVEVFARRDVLGEAAQISP